jgi:para-aminobenzoate synthetase/4-amino-4-deoxychorismate lyase
MPLAQFAIFDRPDATPTRDPGTAFSCGRWQEEIDQSAYERIIRSIREDIGAGRFYQTNFTTRLRAEFAGDAHALFQALRLAQPDSYALFLDFQAWQLCSVSPELFFAWDPVTGVLTTRPMKGTAPAGPIRMRPKNCICRPKTAPRT